MIICTKCHHQNADTERFCEQCGAFLEFAGKPSATSAGLPPPTTATSTSAAPTASESEPTHSLPAPTAVRPDEAGTERPYVPTVTNTEPAVGPGEIACHECGAGNPPTRTFCRLCGASLSDAGAAVAPPANPSDPANRKRLLMIVGGVAAVALIAVLAFVFVGGDDDKSSTATPPATTAAPVEETTLPPDTTEGPTTVPVSVPPTFAPAGTTVCGTPYYAHPIDHALDGLFLLGQIYANCVGERGFLVTPENYVIFPNGDDCPPPGGQGVMLIVFDEPTTVHTVRLEPSLAPIGNFRWPLEVEIVGFPDVITSTETRIGHLLDGSSMVRTALAPGGTPSWRGHGTYNPAPGINRVDATSNNPTPVKAVELRFLKLGDSPGSKAKPDPGCAVHRVEVFSG